MREIILLLTLCFFGTMATEEDLMAKNSTKIALVNDLEGHLNYLLTLIPSRDNTAVKNFLVMEAKVSGDFKRSWQSRQSSITKFIEQDRKVQEWLKSWRTEDIGDSADYFINAAENYKNPSAVLDLEGSDLMNKAYSLLFDSAFTSGNTETKRNILFDMINKIDPKFNDCN